MISVNITAQARSAKNLSGFVRLAAGPQLEGYLNGT
jgi:hypothetical protein